MAKMSQQKRIALANRNIDHSEAWRQIPPEEKIEIMDGAHSKGLFAAVVASVVGATCAVALQEVWLFWGSLLAAPLVFQFAAGKAWRTVKPATMLRYLAARSAARRYAYSAKSKDLELSLIFRGTLERIYGDNLLQEALEAMVQDNKETEVWVALFQDVVVVMSERRGGAALEYAQPISDKLVIESQSPSGKDYANDKEIYLSSKEKGDKNGKIKLTSRFPGALVVFEKRLRAYQSRNENIISEAPEIKIPNKRRNQFDDDDNIDAAGSSGEDYQSQDLFD